MKNVMMEIIKMEMDVQKIVKKKKRLVEDQVVVVQIKYIKQIKQVFEMIHFVDYELQVRLFLFFHKNEKVQIGIVFQTARKFHVLQQENIIKNVETEK